MGDIVPFTQPRHPRHRRSTAAASDHRGEILLFTGVRIDHWDRDDAGPAAPNDGEPVGVRQSLA